MRYRIALIPLLFSVSIVFFSCHENKSDLLTMRAIQDAVLTQKSPSYLNITFRRAYRIPINFEPIYYPEILFEIWECERMQYALDRMTAITNNALTYQIIYGQLCIFSAEQQDSENKNPLDVPVSVKLKCNTVWEAIKQTIIVLNEQNILGEPCYAIPQELEGGYPVNPQLLEKRNFNFSFANAKLREVLCAIFNVSDLDIGYYYFCLPRYHVIQIQSHPKRDFKRFNYDTDVRLSTEEECWWYHEINGLTGKLIVDTPFSLIIKDCEKKGL